MLFPEQGRKVDGVRVRLLRVDPRHPRPHRRRLRPGSTGGNPGPGQAQLRQDHASAPRTRVQVRPGHSLMLKNNYRLSTKPR